LLLRFPAFFADLGYRGVTASFTFYNVPYASTRYGIITAIALSVGDRFDRKYGAIAGNSFTGMAFCRPPICCGRRRCCSPSAGKRAFSARVTRRRIGDRHSASCRSISQAAYFGAGQGRGCAAAAVLKRR
jgi:hypothetical protein